MGETLKSIDGIIEKLALVADGLQTLFPDGTMAVAMELKYDDYKKVQKNFRDVDRNYKKFSIDISGTEFIFVSDELLLDEKDILLKIPSEPKGRISTFFGWLRNQSQKYSRIFFERKTN